MSARRIDPPEKPRILKPSVILALDPGLTTGWALVRATDGKVLEQGDADVDELGEAIDRAVRMTHREGYRVQVVVEQRPTGRTFHGDALDIVDRTVNHWVLGVFGLVPEYIAPGTWKPSRVGRKWKPPRGHEAEYSRHARDAIRMALYALSRRQSRHAAWCWLPADHKGQCEGDQ